MYYRLISSKMEWKHSTRLNVKHITDTCNSEEGCSYRFMCTQPIGMFLWRRSYSMENPWLCVECTTGRLNAVAVKPQKSGGNVTWYPVFQAKSWIPGYIEAKALIASRTSILPDAIFRLHPRWRETDKYCMRTSYLKFTLQIQCFVGTRAKRRTRA